MDDQPLDKRTAELLAIIVQLTGERDVARQERDALARHFTDNKFDVPALIAIVSESKQLREQVARLTEERDTQRRDKERIRDWADREHGRAQTAEARALQLQTALDDGTELECIVAGVISTYPPFDQQHPSSVLPIAKNVVAAIGDWQPADDLAAVPVVPDPPLEGGDFWRVSYTDKDE